MKKTILTILLLGIFPSISYSEWMKVGSDSEKISYIELDTVKHKDAITYFNLMFDYFEPKNGSVLSVISNIAVDCNIDMYRTLQISTYNRSMAKGQIINTFNYDHIGWKPNGNGMMNVICELAKGKY